MVIRLHPDSAGVRSESTEHDKGDANATLADPDPDLVTMNIRGGSHGLGVPIRQCW